MFLDPLTEIELRMLVPVVVGSSQRVMNFQRRRKRRQRH
jgi:hypothetical protein